MRAALFPFSPLRRRSRSPFFFRQKNKKNFRLWSGSRSTAHPASASSGPGL